MPLVNPFSFILNQFSISWHDEMCQIFSMHVKYPGWNSLFSYLWPFIWLFSLFPKPASFLICIYNPAAPPALPSLAGRWGFGVKDFGPACFLGADFTVQPCFLYSQNQICSDLKGITCKQERKLTLYPHTAYQDKGKVFYWLGWAVARLWGFFNSVNPMIDSALENHLAL